MSKKVIINASMAEEIRIAITENNRLVDLDLETLSRSKHKGSVYKGIVSNIEDSLDAAFIEFGEIKQAFLPLIEIRTSLYPIEFQNKKKVKVSDILIRGQEIVVQVTKDEIGNKGAAVTTYLSLPGRYVVLMHSDKSGGGISRKIQNEKARQCANEILLTLNIPDGMAVIIRTAGISCASKDLFKDFQLLCRNWKQIDKGAQLGRAPTLLYREPDIAIRTIRDYFSKDVAKIIIDDEEEFQEIYSFFKEHMPDMVSLLEHHRKKEPIFQFYGIEKAITELFERNVKLLSGGYLVIEQTEALVSIDVNSGTSTKEEDHETTVYKTNMEATEELVRQLRLRDLGGIIIVDFIDMVSKKHRRDVERNLYNLMRSDKARVKVGQIGDNGTLELTRQRLRQSHRLISHVPCTYCYGTGRVRDAEGLAVLALRQISGYLSKKRVALANLVISLPLEVANIINNKKRRELVRLCDLYQLDLEILGNNHLINDTINFKEIRRGQAGLEAAQRVPASRKNKLQLDKWKNQKKELPAHSIGPVPSVIDEETLLTKFISLKSRQNNKNKFFNDPLTQALFGLIKVEDLNILNKKDMINKDQQIHEFANKAGNPINRNKTESISEIKEKLKKSAYRDYRKKSTIITFKKSKIQTKEKNDEKTMSIKKSKIITKKSFHSLDNVNIVKKLDGPMKPVHSKE